MQTKKLVVFDLDGTLNQTKLYSVPAHLTTLKEYGKTHLTEQDIIETYGETVQLCHDVFLPEHTWEEYCEYLKRVSYWETIYIKDHKAAFDGVPQMLKQLRKDGYMIAICSNASKRYISMVLKELDIARYVDFIQEVYLDTTKVQTLGMLLERVSPDAAVMVGDRRFDKEAAVHNELPFIGCLYGYKREEVESADIAVSSPLDIPAAVKELIGEA